MSLSRSPSNFFRSNRRSVTDSTATQGNRNGNLAGDAPNINSPNRLDANVAPLDRSRSSSPSSIPTQMTLRGMERLQKRRTMEERNFLKSKARSQSLNPPVDFRLLDYVSSYDDNLMCPICRCPFVDPVVLNECDHCFCRDCIRQTWTTNSSYSPLGPRGDCPACRTPAKLGPRSSTSKILNNILDELVVKCPKFEDGCKAEVKRGEVQDHISIYCGFAWMECPADECELPVRRKDALQGCLHFGTSCLACHEEIQKCHLEDHWRSKCPDRVTTCGLCKAKVPYGDFREHGQRLCPAINIRCPGEPLGCHIKSNKGEAEAHAQNCTLAKLAPVFTAQKQRMDEQEAAQKRMSRKLEVLEGGFARMHGILYPSADDPDQNSADPSSIPLLQGYGGSDSNPIGDILIRSAGSDDVPIASLDMDSRHEGSFSSPSWNGERPSRPAPAPPGPRPTDLPEPFSPDFDIPSPFSPPATHGPYTSPLHHLLSMHESLRDEMSRVNTALQELDGRHSMQILNENLRTREEISYMGAQLAGLSRQVHWLTSAQLQKQSRSVTPGTVADEIAAAGPSVEAAISSAVRGAARIVNAGREGMAMRRGPSEEGRTKL